MSQSAQDLSRVVLTINGTRIPGNGDAFLSLTPPPSYTRSAAIGGRDSVINSLQDRDSEGTVTASPYSEAHRAIGQLFDVQEATRKAGSPFQGWPVSYVNPGNGDRCVGTLVIMGPPAIEEAVEVSARVWSILIRESQWSFGQSVPVGGGSL